jgi:hypothetical protein
MKKYFKVDNSLDKDRFKALVKMEFLTGFAKAAVFQGERR